MFTFFDGPLGRPLFRIMFGLVAALVVLIGSSVCDSSALACSSSALATTASPAWAVQSVAIPTNFSTSDNERGCEEAPFCDNYRVTATNVGSGSSGGRVVMKDTLPSHVVVEKVAFHKEFEPAEASGFGQEFSCSGGFPGGSSFECEYNGVVPPGGVLEAVVVVALEPGVSSSVLNRVEVGGGGGAPVVTSRPTTEPNPVNGGAPSFGVQDFGFGVYGSDGVAGDTRAGDHPEALLTALDFATEKTFGNFPTLLVQEPKTTIVDLPFGFVGDPLAAGRCPATILRGGNEGGIKCPASSRVGSADVELARSAGAPKNSPVRYF